MIRSLILAMGLMAYLAGPASAEYFEGSGQFQGLVSGTYTRDEYEADGYKTTTRTWKDSPGSAVFSWWANTYEEADYQEDFASVSIAVDGYSGNAETYPPASGRAVVFVDNAPGAGPDTLSLRASTNYVGPGVFESEFELFLTDPTGRYFETGALAGVIVTASGGGVYGTSTAEGYFVERYSFSFVPVPEPSSLALCGIALVGLSIAARKLNAAASGS